jgi:hypothetical protein
MMDQHCESMRVHTLTQHCYEYLWKRSGDPDDELRLKRSSDRTLLAGEDTDVKGELP